MPVIMNTPYLSPSIDGGSSGDVNTLLLIHSDTSNGSAAFIDATGRHTVTGLGTGPGTFHTSDESKFGATSILTTDALSESGALAVIGNIGDWNVGLGDITVDFWLNRTAGGGRYYAFTHGGSSGITQRWSISLEDSGRIAIISGGYSGSWAFDVQTAPVITAPGWHHVAVVRKGTATGGNGNFRIYVDGVLEATYTGTEYNLIHDYDVDIGGYIDDSQTTYIDEVRVSNIERWDAPFTPPTEPY